jgi:hypothetical protein
LRVVGDALEDAAGIGDFGVVIEEEDFGDGHFGLRGSVGKFKGDLLFGEVMVFDWHR